MTRTAVRPVDTSTRSAKQVPLVIPAAGLGHRFLPTSRVVPKELLPMGTKPLIHHALDEAEGAGFDRVVVVIAPSKSLIRTYFERGDALELARRLHLEFVEQPRPNGVGEAVLLAAQHLKVARCAVLLPDDLVTDHRHWDALFSLHSSSGASCLCIRPVTVSESDRFGMVGCEVVGSRLRVTELAEKPRPEDSPSNLAIFGRYVVTAPVLEALETLCGSRRRISEVSLTEGLAEAVSGEPGVFAVPFHGEMCSSSSRPTALMTPSWSAIWPRSTLAVRYYQASTSEMFGSSDPPQKETTPFRPRSPYATSKVYAHWTTINYREGHKLFASCGILFNHESPRRGENFVTRKVTRGIAQILAGKMAKLWMGNLQAKRDWGHARDYVEAMWLMLQQDVPDDFVIATGVSRSVSEFVETAFGMVGLDWRKYVEIDRAYMRPTDVAELCGDASKAFKALGWQPKTSFAELIHEMLENDLRLEGLDPNRLLRHLVAEPYSSLRTA